MNYTELGCKVKLNKSKQDINNNSNSKNNSIILGQNNYIYTPNYDQQLIESIS